MIFFVNTYIYWLLHNTMSKKEDRYKADLNHLDLQELDELETKKFERFHPKKKVAPKKKQKIADKDDE